MRLRDGAWVRARLLVFKGIHHCRLASIPRPPDASRALHIVLLNQYYPPDAAPTGRMLEDVAEALAGQGHEITVLCSRGSYTGEGHGDPAPPASRNIRILRTGISLSGRKSFPGKIAGYAGYYAGAAWTLATLSPKPCRIVALTSPPYLSLLARALSRLRGGDHAHWVMDLYPDVMAAHGMLSPGSLSYRFLARLARAGFGGRRCAAVLCLGDDMVDRLAAHTPANHPVSMVPLWSSAPPPPRPEETSALREQRGWGRDDLVFMYSGNMGLGHRFDEFLAAARDPVLPRCRFAFFGDGKRRGEIEHTMATHPGAPIELHGYAPSRQLAVHLSTADVHLASLEPSWDGCMVPSKLQGIFSSGRPVIHVGSPGGSTARWITDGGAGWVVPPGDHAALRQALREAADPGERQRRGNAALAYARKHFQKAGNVSRIASILSLPR